ncbi:MAG: amino acid ABC transporter substrate-binding protein [Rhodomicrobium sp.]
MTGRFQSWGPALWAFALLFPCAAPVYAGTAGDVRTRGHLNCGVTEGHTGFSAADAAGNWTGLDTDFCRAVAGAVLGDGTKVRFVPVSKDKRFSALLAGEIDVLPRVAWTMQNATGFGISFAGVIYYENQGLMVRKKLEVQSALELSGTEVCTAAGTAAESSIADFFRSHGMPYRSVTFAKPEEALSAYEGGRCDAYAASVSSLSSQRQKLTNPEDHIVLPEPIAMEPQTPAVRAGDPQWLSVVSWTLFALIDAEELGVTKDNAASLAAGGAAPGVKHLLGGEDDLGKPIGLGKDWALRAVEAVGNYGEMFEGNLGAKSSLNIDRGLNRLWNKGGILFAPPVR